MSEKPSPMKKVYIELAVLFGCMVLSAIVAACLYDYWSDLDIKRHTITAPTKSLYTFLISTPVAYVLSHGLRRIDYSCL